MSMLPNTFGPLAGMVRSTDLIRTNISLLVANRSDACRGQSACDVNLLARDNNGFCIRGSSLI
jgi:hypothetical protein